jgi:ABC-type branched-subunit amino acid transport system substrate-binding protein
MAKNFVTSTLLVLALFLSSCGGIQMLGGRGSLYSEEFLAQINQIKTIHRSGNADEALSKLQGLSDETLNSSEKAFKQNLIGVIQFGQKRYDQSITSFENALLTSRQDPSLTAQINLNLASSYFRLDMKEKAYAILMITEYKYLDKPEFKKFNLLKANLAEELHQKVDYAESLMLYLSDKEDISSLKGDAHFDKLLQVFFELSRAEKIKLLEKHERETYVVSGYLGYLDGEKAYYQSQKDESKNLMRWVERRFSKNDELIALVNAFQARIENTSKVDPYAIGLILPLSESKKSFGDRALTGIDLALKKSAEVRKEPFVLHVRDNQGSAIVGAYAVNDLVEKHNVSIIIGGLFSSEATAEYLEARKNGVFFISLSEIYLPKEQKDFLLLEIPGSVESQVDHVFSNQMLTHFGKKAAILYPKGEKGESYVEEFWRRARLAGVEVTNAISFDDTASDFVDPVKNMLHLKFPRQRKEEFDMLSEVHGLERSRAIRRVQTLGPQIDFDWVFIAAYPRETLQIIPYFSYFDAFGLNIIGGPSWRTDSLAKQSSKLGRIYFVGDDVLKNFSEFNQNFFKEYQRPMRIIEMRAFDALQVANTIIEDRSFSSRDQIESRVRQISKLSGLTGEWSLKDNVWIKNMTSMQIHRGKVSNLFEAKPL